MPIPTRAKSTSVKPTSTIPNRKPSTREVDRDLISQTALSNVQPDVHVDVRGMKDLRTRTTSQIRPPNLHIRNASTASLPAPATTSGLTRPQSSLTSSTISDSQTRRRQEAVNTSRQTIHTSTRSNAKVISKNDANNPSARPIRARQVPMTTTQPIRPRSVISLASDSSNTSTSNRIEDSTSQTRKDELLQLSMTHLHSQQTLSRLERHMQQNLTKRFQTVSDQEIELLRLERQRQRTNNSKALQAWLHTKHDCNNIQRIQALSMAIQKLNSYDFETECTETLQAFQEWIDKFIHVQETRWGQGQANGLQFVTSIGQEWQRRASGVEESLSMIIATLEDGSPKEERSGIAVSTLQNLKLAKVLLQEIQTALWIEETVMLFESDWEQEQISRVVNDPFPSMESDVGIWAI